MIEKKTKREELKLFNTFSKEWWDENGSFKVLHKIRPLRMRYILDQIKDEKIKNLEILDVGCGGGLICESLSRIGATVTGLDFVKDNINTAKMHAKKNLLNIRYLCEDIEQFKSKKKFDIIIAFEVLEHIENWPKILKKTNSLLKKNGILIISTINRNILSKILVINIGENILRWIPKGTHQFEKLIKPQELEKQLKVNNFKVINFKGLKYNPLRDSWGFSDNLEINYFCCSKKIN